MGSVGALFGFLLAASAAPAHPPAPITYDELRTLPDEVLARRLFGALAPDLVLGLRPDEERASFVTRARIWFWTRPRPSAQPGVCETDRSILAFQREPVGVGVQRENPTLRLAGIATRTYFIIHDLELAEERTRPDPDRPAVWGAACGGLDPRRDGVPADSAWQLMRARALMTGLGDAARAGRSEVPLDCAHVYWNREGPADLAACLAALRHLGSHNVQWVDECRGVPGAANCIRVLASDLFIEFSLDVGQQAIAVRAESVQDTSAIE